MGYYDEFPRTNFYQQDLGWLIKQYKELSDNYDILVKIYEIIEKEIKDITIEQLQEWLDNSTLENIINQTLFASKMSWYKDIEEMKKDDTLLKGMIVYCGGYNTCNDGGHAMYYISDENLPLSVHFNNLYAQPILDEINIEKFGCVGDGITDNTNIFKEIVMYVNSIPNGIFKNGINIIIPKGTFLLNDTFVFTNHNIKIKGKSLNESMIVTPSDFSKVLFSFGSTNGSALYSNGVEDLTIHTVRYDDEKTPTSILLNKCNYCSIKNVHLISVYNGIEAWDCGKLFIENVHEFYNEDVSMNKGIVVSGADIHITNCQILPPIYKYINCALEIRDTDGLYITNSHFEGCVIINGLSKDNSNVKCINTQISNCYFDRSMKDNIQINCSVDNGIRNLCLSNCSIYADLTTSGIVYNTNEKCGLILLNNILFGNCKTAILCSNGTDINVNNCNFINSQINDIFLKGRVRVYGCVFKNSSNKISSIDSVGGILNIIISLCDFSESTVTANQITNIGTSGNIILNNINSNI